MRQESCA